MSGGFSHTDIIGAIGKPGDLRAGASRLGGEIRGGGILHRGIDAGNFTVVVAAVCAGNGSHAGSRRAIRLLNSGSRRTDDGAAFHVAADRHGDGLANVVLDQFVGAVGRACNVCAVSLPLIRECAGVAGDRSGYGSQDLVVLRCTRDAGRAAQRTGRGRRGIRAAGVGGVAGPGCRHQALFAGHLCVRAFAHSVQDIEFGRVRVVRQIDAVDVI